MRIQFRIEVVLVLARDHLQKLLDSLAIWGMCQMQT